MHFDGAIAVSMIPMSRRRPKLKIDFSLRTDNQTGTQHNSHVVEADLGHRKTNLNFKRRGGANLYLPKSEKSMLYLRKYGKWLFVSPFRQKKAIGRVCLLLHWTHGPISFVWLMTGPPLSKYLPYNLQQPLSHQAVPPFLSTDWNLSQQHHLTPSPIFCPSSSSSSSSQHYISQNR